MWYSGGSLKGDARSKSLVESWRDNTLMLKGQYKVSLLGLSSVCCTPLHALEYARMFHLSRTERTWSVDMLFLHEHAFSPLALPSLSTALPLIVRAQSRRWLVFCLSFDD